MNDTQKQTGKSRKTLWTVLITVFFTLLVAGAAAYFTGYLDFGGPVERQMAAEDAEETLYTCSMHPQIVTEEPGNCPICGMKLVPKQKDKAGAEKAGGDREIAYWRAPMNPQEIYDQPGKSAMGMDLIPVYKDELVGGVDISIDPVTEQNMGIRTAEVKRGPLVHTIRTYGHVTYDETLMARINLKFGGWIEKLYVDFTGAKVERGEPMFDIYSPELITAQQDLIEAYQNYRRQPNETNKKVLESVKSRLRYFDIAASEIEEIMAEETVKHALTIRSPYPGVVVDKNVLEGDYMESGTTIYKIADLSSVWVEAHIYEYELTGVKKGQPVEMTLPYLPGEKYLGEVAYVYPYLQRQTRDVVVRLDFANPDLTLKPDMYADVRIRTTFGKKGIHVPDSAVIRSGKRNIAFVRRAPGKFTPREVKLGMPLDNDRVQILQGLAPGEQVVVSGQFLLDSETKLQEGTRKMEKPETEPEEPETEPEEADISGAEGKNDFFEELEDRDDTQKENDSDGFFEDLEQK